jgi:aminoglycoside 3-N-acetyltransferase
VPDIKYRDLITHLGIAPGSVLMVAADLTRLAMTSRRKEGEFSTTSFLESLQRHLGKEGTLVIPAFNFNLKDNAQFNPSRTMPVTGALAVEALKRPDFRRTRHPLHSFMVWGKYAPALAGLDNKSSFGPDSPFSFLKEHHCRMLFIDTRIQDAFTFVHYVEESAKVKYRKYKKINLVMEDEDGTREQREFLLFAKRPGWTMKLSGLEELLTEKNVAKSIVINHVDFIMVDLEAAYPEILNDIHSNNARNLAFFSPGLYFREKAKQLLAAFGIHTLADKISHDPGIL